MTRRTAIALAGVLALAACGRAAEVPAGKLAFEAVKARGPRTLGMTPPANLPAYAPIPRDSFVTAAAIGEAGSGSAEFSTALAPDAVMDFYRSAAAEHGLKPGRIERRKTARVFTGERLTVEAERIEGVGSTVRLRYP
jgi:hypothetical protein